MVFQVIERLVQWRMVVLAISNPLYEGLPVVSPSTVLRTSPSALLRTSPSAEFTVSEAELLRTGPVEPLSADSLARLWSGFSPVTGGVPFDLAHTQHATP